jgi:hypothetical protein
MTRCFEFFSKNDYETLESDLCVSQVVRWRVARQRSSLQRFAAPNAINGCVESDASCAAAAADTGDAILETFDLLC